MFVTSGTTLGIPNIICETLVDIIILNSGEFGKMIVAQHKNNKPDNRFLILFAIYTRIGKSIQIAETL